MFPRGRVVWAALAAALVVAGCAPSGSVPQRPHRGTADVAFAGSLELVMDRYLGPGFVRAQGYGYQGRGGGSLGLAQEVLAGEITPNVFISVGGSPLALLEPRYTRWAVRIASSPLVVAYYPKGPHAAELRQISEGRLPLRDLFLLLAEPGFRLGRTDPATDPQGQAFAMMVQLASRNYDLPPAVALADLGGESPGDQIYPETSLVAQLQAGQLDAASSFRSQALQLGLPFVALPAKIDFGDPQDLTTYRQASLEVGPGRLVHGFLLDVEATVLGRSDYQAALAFVRYLISIPGRRVLAREGYSTPAPLALGDSRAVPASISSSVPSS